ncbi:MAG TPA: hypothetical protein VNF68_01615, partial [Candidatus Baltobacteraceae bacterium]|nr:hypothetical protein [Candidatus Baltobacteraceae bacterium]
PPVSPGAAVRGPDGRIWGADRLSGGLAAVTTAGVVTQYTAPPLYATLTIGTDGYLYAGDGALSGAIEKISPSTGTSLSSTVTTYPVVGAATGPDGNVWVTESGSSSGIIGVLTPSGVLNQYNVSIIPSPTPVGIAAAPDGTMWFCDNQSGGGASEIDSVSMTGTFTLVASIASDTCGSIAFQSDGKAAWVASGATTNAYRIDAATHAVATVALSGTPYAIAAGADNAIYITETGGATGWVARIGNTAASPYTPSEIVVPNGFPTGIALGADGRMWYGENSVDKIGALSP